MIIIRDRGRNAVIIIMSFMLALLFSGCQSTRKNANVTLGTINSNLINDKMYSTAEVKKKIFSDEQLLSIIKKYTNGTDLYSKASENSPKLVLSELDMNKFYDAFIKQSDGTIAQCTFARNHNMFAYRRSSDLTVFPESVIDEETQSFAPQKPPISHEIAYQQAVRYANDIGADELSLFTSETCTITCGNKNKTYGWIFTFTREFEGLRKLYSPSGYYINPKIVPSYGAPWEQEFLKVVIDSKGLCQIWYEGASEINRIGKKVELIQFEAIKDLAIKYLQDIFAPESGDEDILDIYITKFELGIDLISSENSTDVGEYIPTWTVSFTYGYKNAEKRSSMMIILNAIDGSYIEPRVTNSYLSEI